MDNEKEFEVFRKLNFLLRILHKQHTSCEHKSLFSQGMILKILSVRPKISQKELSSMIDVSKQSLSETLSKLEKSNLITRTSSDEDKRSLIIEITDKGKDYVNNYITDSCSKNTVLKDFSDEDLTIFNGYLDKIIAKFENTNNFNEELIERRKSLEKFLEMYK